MKALLRRFRRLILGVVIFCVLFTIAGVFLGPPLVTPYLLREFSKDFGREVTVQKVRVYPWRLAVGLHGIAFRERESGALLASFDELFANVQSISPLKGAIVLGELKAVRPYLHIVRNPDLTYNFSDIVERFSARPGPPWKYRFSIRNIRVVDGSADFDDRPKDKRHTVTELIAEDGT